MQQVLDAVEQAPSPAAENDRLDLGPVLDDDAQQFGQVGRAPVPGDIALCKTDVAGFERGGADVPVVKRQRRVGQGLATKALHAAVWKLHRQAAMAQALQHFEDRARCGRCSGRQSETFAGGVT